ncbi:uncharacterized protein F4807DRAFT_420398 [Annulohypoxylon truncatum]|uniref:uncharacterized protein n=1 Tax=Annulohypoxylon truncatum TaxID=327061 RepID=UPI00200728AA|nr:uncharacterized protein F4807DRAFT_420398 [Annulohypoxylon truncatum]KAI1211443.1 hypothetical protein F4807DRAFT_420398 [Annulohypoxylon truncatum]
MSDGVCGGSKNALLTHFDRNASRETQESRERRLQREVEESLFRDSLKWDEMIANAQFKHFQSGKPLLPTEHPAHIPGPSMPQGVQSFNAPPGLGMLNGYGPQQPSTAFRPHAYPATPMKAQSAHQSWVDQFQRLQPLPNMIHSPGSRSVNNHVDHRLSAPMHMTPAQVPMPAPALPPLQEPTTVTGNLKPHVEFDSAFQGWMDAIAGDETLLWTRYEGPDSAPASVPAQVPDLAPKAPEQPVAHLAADEPVRTQEQTTTPTERVRNSEDSKLAVAAQEIINSVSNDQSDKFQQSEFLSLMRRIASMDLVVRDNALVNPDTLAPAETKSSSSGESISKAGRVQPKKATVEDEE